MFKVITYPAPAIMGESSVIWARNEHNGTKLCLGAFKTSAALAIANDLANLLKCYPALELNLAPEWAMINNS